MVHMTTTSFIIHDLRVKTYSQFLQISLSNYVPSSIPCSTTYLHGAASRINLNTTITGNQRRRVITKVTNQNSKHTSIGLTCTYRTHTVENTKTHSTWPHSRSEPRATYQQIPKRPIRSFATSRKPANRQQQQTKI